MTFNPSTISLLSALNIRSYTQLVDALDSSVGEPLFSNSEDSYVREFALSDIAGNRSWEDRGWEWDLYEAFRFCEDYSYQSGFDIWDCFDILIGTATADEVWVREMRKGEAAIDAWFEAGLF